MRRWCFIDFFCGVGVFSTPPPRLISLSITLFLMRVASGVRVQRPNAPINVKPEGGGGGSGNPREFDCDVCPQGGDFDHLTFQLQREEEKKTILLTIIFCPGVGILIYFFRKCQNPHPLPDPPPPPPQA